MDQAERRRTQLAQLLDLAQTYRGWTRKELAKSLRRDPTKLIPGSGVPKLDYVMDLSRVLDWSVEQVVSHLMGQGSGETGPDNGEPLPDEFEAIDDAARDAHRAGQYRRIIELSERSFAVATTPEQRARSCNREAGGWDGLGRYSKVLNAIQRGLKQRPVSAEYRRMLQSNLANAYYCLWSLVEARAVSGDLLAWYQEHPPETTRDRKTEAFANYVSGHAHRRIVSNEPTSCDFDRLSRLARRRLETARDLYTRLAADLDDESFAGIANTCSGGLLELQVLLEERDAEAVLDEFVEGLEHVRDTSDPIIGDKLESYGWWCIFGCNIALRSIRDERQLQQYMAVFSNKADEIAEKLDSWTMRERVFTMEHSRWERAVGCTGFDIPRVVDEDEVRVIAGTMARFPSFRDTGWEILKSARVVRDAD